MHSFSFNRPTDVAAAIAAASATVTAQQGATVRYLAGGTTLVDLMKLGVERPETIVDVRGLGFDTIREDEDGGLEVGATVRNADLARNDIVGANYRALSEALMAGASPQLRNAATTAGNLLQRTRCVYFRDVASPCNKRLPGSGCPAIKGTNRTLAILGTSRSCIATHPSDMAVAMLAYEATVTVRGANNERRIPLMDFYRLPGDRPDIENVLQPGDLITSVKLPARPQGERAGYLKLRDRASYEFALASAAAAVVVKNGRIASARLALGGVGTRPWRVVGAEKALVGQAPGTELFRHAADVALARAEPQSENGFKIELARRCVIALLDRLTAAGEAQ
ncbi:MAG TPA: xanthine dehydrogenase family protein subunit M [Devosiaceae bacterium]|jgi:xanthine dehydrogenase YagS FAD-binding subunit